MAKNKSRKSLRKIQKSKNKTYRKKFTGGYGVSNFSELSTKHYYSPNNPSTTQ